MSNLYEHIKKVLAKNENYCKNGKLFKNIIVENALKLTPDLLELLLSDEKATKHFFTKINTTYVFDKIKFQKFVSNKQFLPDSYTAFKNKIGLTVDDEYLTEAGEVVLSWPYKDCILEGGQTKEEQKKDEVFYNETLAPDEIDRLFEPKALTNFKRYDKDGEHKVTDISINDNFIIKGNNLLALHSLKKVYKNKIKLIYIDPPYNTGNDGFNYNDSFNHSTWLTFMKNRLEVAKELLRNDGVIFVQCDDNEQAYLKILMNEIFDRKKTDYMVWQKTDPRYDQNTNAKVIKRFKRIHEHILIAYKGDKNNYKFNKIMRLPEWTKKQSNPDKDPRGCWQSGIVSYEEGHKNEDKNSEFYYTIELPSKRKMTRHFFVKQNEFNNLLKDGRIYFPKEGDGIPRIKIFEDEEKEYHCDSIMRGFGTSSTAKKELELLEFPLGKFDTPKPEKLLAEIIRMTTKENDIVLDFFSGSGTTGSVAHKMNRQYILIEQMDYIHDLPEERLKKVIAGEQGGISKSVKWQGGGGFTYLELAKNSTKYVDKIEQATNSKTLLNIWNNLKKEKFISYKITIDEVDKIMDDFKKMDIKQQKLTLMAILDKNDLYVNLSDINDNDYQLDKNTKTLNEVFYNNGNK
ncbi:MAG: site-specific DNA-methyltransferase [Gammaproteobacteria bacterium]|nr:MAG: site-specific DNA-methyltransferase [Gammaproteobacteria bacterium]